MKTFFSLLICLMLSSLLSAQDQIIKKNGDQLYGKVYEITPSDIKYTDTLTTDSIRTIAKSEVLIILFRNGTREVFAQPEPIPSSPQTPSVVSAPPAKQEGPIVDLGSNDFSINGRYCHFREVKSLLLSMDDPEINRLLVQARVHGIVGNVLAYSSIPVGVIGFSLVAGRTPSPGIVHGTILSALCVGFNVGNIVFKISKKKKIQEALDIYNRKIEEPSLTN